MSAVRGTGSLIKHRPLRSLIPMRLFRRSTHSFSKDDFFKAAEHVREEIKILKRQETTEKWKYWTTWVLTVPPVFLLAIDVINHDYELQKFALTGMGSDKHQRSDVIPEGVDLVEQAEIDLAEVVPFDLADSPHAMGDLSKVVTPSDIEDSISCNLKAMQCIAEDKLDDAVHHLTCSILSDPRSSSVYCLRAQAFIKMRKPIAAIRDCVVALGINPDCAEALKARGEANALLGRWAEAARDLQNASKLFYEEEILSIAAHVNLKAENAREQLRVLDWVRKDKEGKRAACERMGRQAEAQVCVSSNSNDGFSGLLRIIEDTELMEKMTDPKIVSAIRDVSKYPDSLDRYKIDSKVGPALFKVKAYFDGTS